MTTMINNGGQEYMDAEYEPPALSLKETMIMFHERKQGNIKLKELMNEALVCVRNLTENITDKCFTYLHSEGRFSV
jgi:hypothetical protein